MSIQVRINQIEQTAIRVVAHDVNRWVKSSRPSAADSILIAPADLAWLIAVARGDQP